MRLVTGSDDEGILLKEGCLPPAQNHNDRNESNAGSEVQHVRAALFHEHKATDRRQRTQSKRTEIEGWAR
jgi:hypothetical protein